MARIMRMPPKSELPEGPHRAFVEELRRYYRAASHPPLRQVSRAIEGRDDLKEVTASQETVRRMLRGMVLPTGPTGWDRVYAVFFVLCEMGNIDPKPSAGKTPGTTSPKATLSASSGYGTSPWKRSPILRPCPGPPCRSKHPRTSAKTIHGQLSHRATATSRRSSLRRVLQSTVTSTGHALGRPTLTLRMPTGPSAS